MAYMSFKVWDGSRSQKKFITIPSECEEMLKTLIQKGSKKLNIAAEALVLESDGTQVDDDETLKIMNKEIFLLLKKNEEWLPAATHSNLNESFCSNISLPSTVTVYDESPRDSPNSSISSHPESRSSTRSPVAESTWTEFEIPAGKFTTATLNDFNNGCRNYKTMKDAIHIVAAEMMEISDTIPTKACKTVANKLVAQYPKIFQDVDDDGVIIGDGSITVYSQLKEHIKYVKSSKRRCASERDFLVPVNKRKKISNLKAGCSNWQPNVDDANLEQSVQEKLKSVNFETFDENTESMLESSYPLQRVFLNRLDPHPPSLAEIKEEWPILLSHNGINFHFKKLMQVDIQCLTSTLLEKANKFITLGLKKKYIRERPNDNNENTILSVLRIITSYFSEKLESLLVHIKDEMEIQNLTTKSPIILFVTENNSNSYFVVMENQRISEANNILENALQEMFSLYFILNLEYPKEVSNTLEFIQMYFLKIHPPQGSRNKKKSKSKIVSLLNKLKSE